MSVHSLVAELVGQQSVISRVTCRTSRMVGIRQQTTVAHAADMSRTLRYLHDECARSFANRARQYICSQGGVERDLLA